MASSPIQTSKKSPRIYRASAWGAVSCRKRKNARAMSGRCSCRCRSEISRIILVFNDLGFLDDHVFGRYVLVAAAVGGFNLFNGVDHVHTVDHFTKHGVAPALDGGCAVVEEAVVFDVDE